MTAAARVDPRARQERPPESLVAEAVAEERSRAIHPCPAAWKPGTGEARHDACRYAVRA